jgi:hypothetical protein
VVGQGRVKLVSEVAVGEMQFQPLEACRQGSLGCRYEGILNLCKVLDAHLSWKLREIGTSARRRSGSAARHPSAGIRQTDLP